MIEAFHGQATLVPSGLGWVRHGGRPALAGHGEVCFGLARSGQARQARQVLASVVPSSRGLAGVVGLGLFGLGTARRVVASCGRLTASLRLGVAWLGCHRRAWHVTIRSVTASLGRLGLSRPGEARPRTARRGEVRHGESRQACLVEARHGPARQCPSRLVGLGASRRGPFWHGKAGTAGRGKARWGKPLLGRQKLFQHTLNSKHKYNDRS